MGRFSIKKSRPPEASHLATRRASTCPVLPRAHSPVTTAAPPCGQLPLMVSEHRLPDLADTHPSVSGAHSRSTLGWIRCQHHNRLPLCHRGCRPLGRTRPGPCRSHPHRVDEGVRPPERKTAADRPHRRGPALLLRKAQEHGIVNALTTADITCWAGEDQQSARRHARLSLLGTAGDPFRQKAVI